MARFTAEEAHQAALDDMALIACMLASAQKQRLIDLNTAAELRPYFLGALHNRRVERGELESY